MIATHPTYVAREGRGFWLNACIVGGALLIWLSLLGAVVAGIIVASAANSLGGGGSVPSLTSDSSVFTDPSGATCPQGWQGTGMADPGYCP